MTSPTPNAPLNFIDPARALAVASSTGLVVGVSPWGRCEADAYFQIATSPPGVHTALKRYAPEFSTSSSHASKSSLGSTFTSIPPENRSSSAPPAMPQASTWAKRVPTATAPKSDVATPGSMRVTLPSRRPVSQNTPPTDMTSRSRSSSVIVQPNPWSNLTCVTVPPVSLVEYAPDCSMKRIMLRVAS